MIIKTIKEGAKTGDRRTVGNTKDLEKAGTQLEKEGETETRETCKRTGVKCRKNSQIVWGRKRRAFEKNGWFSKV